MKRQSPAAKTSTALIGNAFSPGIGAGQLARHVLRVEADDREDVVLVETRADDVADLTCRGWSASVIRQLDPLRIFHHMHTAA